MQAVARHLFYLAAPTLLLVAYGLYDRTAAIAAPTSEHFLVARYNPSTNAPTTRRNTPRAIATRHLQVGGRIRLPTARNSKSRLAIMNSMVIAKVPMIAASARTLVPRSTAPERPLQARQHWSA
jgi:hypothetical protein